MSDKHQSLFSESFLRSVWDSEFKQFIASPKATQLLERLHHWADRYMLNETAAEGVFVDTFFKQTWNYTQSGEKQRENGYTCWPQFPVKSSGQSGGTGKADVALGFFSDGSGIPQVLCEFKDIRSGLDRPQNRKGNTRSPVAQCMDYLRESRSGLTGSVLPEWGLVTDMNEFRLYHWSRPGQYQQFIISSTSLDSGAMLGNSDAASFNRFLFWKMFQLDTLLSPTGTSTLEKLLNQQFVQEKTLEKDFYRDYQAYRETVFNTLVKLNPSFKGHEGRLVKLTQRFLDRTLFVLFCEDMGTQLGFPPHLLRDILISRSKDEYFDPDDDFAWQRVKQIFNCMRDGNKFHEHKINRFNGGLFALEPELEDLHIPTSLFCAKDQGNREQIDKHKQTLLYFSANYNFGTSGSAGERVIDLYTLGRIFEQSITDLEYMEAKAEGRESLVELSKRKRDGVYYTPEWVTASIVKDTICARLNEIKTEMGVAQLAEITDEEIAEYRKWDKDRRRARPLAARAKEYLEKLDEYGKRFDRFTVVDPACGSGAFLVQAFKVLLDERKWIVSEKARIRGARDTDFWDMNEVLSDILSKNIYGVDINAESVEITKLALWLNTTMANSPLTSLDNNICCGNSLIGPDFFDVVGAKELFFSERDHDRVKPFDWKKSFPVVFARGGFDCVIGNPPYVKLQHFRKVEPDVAEYLVNAKLPDGNPVYESTQTGNFDLYLPFIEKGLELLHPHGKMGFIAPNVWLVNEYGLGLRKKLLKTRQMDRWVDFKSFQVFEEAITYTALQFFTGAENDGVRCTFAPKGECEIGGMDWDQNTDMVPYTELSNDGWNFMPAPERRLFLRLSKECTSLEDSCKAIVVGVQTSADDIYHMKRVGPQSYVSRANSLKESVEMEDAIMHPLVSGPDAKRYHVPVTTTYLIFPYDIRNGQAGLLSPKEMFSRFPKALGYLSRFEKELRAREKNSFDDNEWYRFGRNQNIDKQELPKLMVPRLVQHLFATVDEDGSFYLDNVDVNGILVDDVEDLYFIAGILNAPVANFIWLRISKPFQNDFFSANKQFIAPLPVPHVNEQEKAEIARMARELQQLHTERRDKMLAIGKRLESPQTLQSERDAGWLWADVKTTSDLKKFAPAGLSAREVTAWAKVQHESLLSAHLENLDGMLIKGVTLSVESPHEGEIQLLIDGKVALSVFSDDWEFIAAQWRFMARQTNITEKFKAKTLVAKLLNLRTTTNPDLKRQVISLDHEIDALDRSIAATENALNKLTYRLYNLTEEEQRMVEAS